MIINNIIWPFLFKGFSLYLLLFVIIMTIFLEALFMYLLVDRNYKRALKISFIVNIISGLLGIFVLPLLTFEHYRNLYNNDLLKLNIDIIWIKVFIITFILSVLIEFVLSIGLYKKSLVKLFLSLMIGNLLTYWIAWKINDMELKEFRTKIENTQNK